MSGIEAAAADHQDQLPADETSAGAGEGLTGRRLGRYRVGAVLHDGPMSTLYRAVDVRLDRPVALKVISPLLAADEEFRARFVDEARNTSAVDHPHVVPLYDHDEIDGHLYLAMRLVEGTTLADQIAGHPLPAARVLALLGQVASALDAVHEHGLVHLDVKPANILITSAHHAHQQPRHPGGEHVYLADFGLTRRGAAPAHTAAGHFLGSPAYAAPEHLRGEAVDAASDLYSLGCVAHTALTGRAPYTGSLDEVIAGHLHGAPPPASTARAAHRPAPEPGLVVGPAVDALLAAALSRDPAARPSSAAELCRVLRAAMTRDAAPAHPGPRPAPRHLPRPTSTPRADTTQPANSSAARSSSPTGPSRSVHSQAVRRRTAAPVAPLAADPFTGTAPRARPRNLHAVVAITVGVLAVLLALGLALFLP